MGAIPVSVIGGYLGAGKTTLLNALLNTSKGVRTAVLVNDFGSVNVDAELIASSGADTIALTNGCTCCTIGGDLILALKGIVERNEPPERIVIEASGVADPGAVARLAACHPDLAVRGTVVVVDAETICARVDDKYVGGLVRRQIANADTIVLSKLDLVDPRHAGDARRVLQRLAPGVPAIEAVGGAQAPAAVVFDPDFVGSLRDVRADSATADHPEFAAMTYRRALPLDRAHFDAFVQRLLPVAVRAKGTVVFRGDPAAYAFQLAGERWSLETRAQSGPAETVLVAIAVARCRHDLAEIVGSLDA